MNPPLDYPTENDVRPMNAFDRDVTLAILLDRHASEQPVSNQMIEQACRRMEAAHEMSIDTRDDANDRSFARFLKVFR